MALSTELLLTSGTPAANIDFPAKQCAGKWANTNVGSPSIAWGSGLDISTSADGFSVSTPGMYTVAWNVAFGDVLTPPNLGLQSWIQLSGSSTRYGLGTPDQNSTSDPARKYTSRGAASLYLSDSWVVQLWVCNGHNDARTTSPASWLTIIRHP